MTWTNAFDLGACTVKVSRTGADYYSGVIAKGGSSGPIAGAAVGEVLQAMVSSTGDVSLEWVSGTSPSYQYELRVIPSFDISSSGIRVSSINIPNGTPGAYAFASRTAFPPEKVDLTFSAGAWFPDPADLSALTSKSEMSVYMGPPV